VNRWLLTRIEVIEHLSLAQCSQWGRNNNFDGWRILESVSKSFVEEKSGSFHTKLVILFFFDSFHFNGTNQHSRRTYSYARWGGASYYVLADHSAVLTANILLKSLVDNTAIGPFREILSRGIDDSL
jgi:hypothetical protein